ncbi:hypothetical protein F5Y08DRAFT_231591 [Xylaria arbuscula]|nr:hypothetical protein F5Y08DRAFT_231591 [Xylaria arbuscula]
MQFKTLALSLFAAVAAAESIDQLVAEIPSCATTCLNDAAKKAGCAVDDYTCQCTNILSITTDALPCVSGACSTDDLTKTSETTSNLCLQVAQQAGGDAYNSALDSLTSAIASATSSIGSEITGTATSTTATQTSDAASAGSASPTATPGAANQAVAGMGMVGAAAIFALAL